MSSSDMAFDVSALVYSPYYDIALCLAVAAGAYVWVKMFNFFAERRMLEQVTSLHPCHSAPEILPLPRSGTLTRAQLLQKLSRKLIHITSGPLFMLTWPLFR